MCGGSLFAIVSRVLFAILLIPLARSTPTSTPSDQPPPVAFGDLLRRYRRLAELTQEELAERAGLSTRSICDFERGGTHTPRRATVDLLAGALALSPERKAELEGVICRRRGPKRSRRIRLLK